MRRPKIFWTLSALGIAAGASAPLYFFDLVPALVAWVFGISATTMVFYGMDKFFSRHDAPRIPELTLHSLALFGGTVGALVGQVIFKHKTAKISFRIVFLAIAAAQAAAIAYLVVNQDQIPEWYFSLVEMP
ncbi:MAG: DUF1294 domain-containing protein [Planctomycetes bacterium]|nr:DUF1294 domain-containing protein [Planctomycetota bacterium]